MDWISRINTLYECNDGRAQLFESEYKACQIELIKKRTFFDSMLVLICVVKNDLIRIKSFLDHYRKLGVKQFVFVDNKSTDGTFEFLLEQSDCDVYRCNQMYSSLRRVVWLNKLISMYGCNQWYIMVDSDEFIFYQGMEKVSLVELVKYAEDNQISRISGYLIDMYSKGELFKCNGRDDFREECRFFDKEGYDIHNTPHGVSISGGPRYRMFRSENELAKCPIFRLEKNDIVASAHYILPRIKAKNNPIWLAIGHYKFLDLDDIEKINEAVTNENYALGSQEYKKYQKGILDGVNSFYDEKISLEYNDSTVFIKMPYITFPLGGIHE